MFCKKCGAQLEEGAVFCQNCGARIEENNSNSQTVFGNADKRPEKKKSGLVKGILIAIGVLIIVIAAAVLMEGKNEKGTSTEEISAGKLKHTELSDYADYTEDELMEELGLAKTESGYYPNDDNINFMCLEGKVYLIRLDMSHPADSQYSLFGVQLGENAEDVRDILNGDFEFVNTAAIDTEQEDVYIEKDTGYTLVIDYNSDLQIIRMSYILEADETAGEMEEVNGAQEEQDEIISSDSELEAEVTEEIRNEACEVIPGYTYESDQSNEEIGDFRLYMNLTFNEDDSIYVFGWGYENQVLSENCFVEETVRLINSDEYTNEYVSDDGDFYLYEFKEYGYYKAMRDYNYFTGDFYLVAE